jgi:hypothetical protein
MELGKGGIAIYEHFALPGPEVSNTISADKPTTVPGTNCACQRLTAKSF